MSEVKTFAIDTAERALNTVWQAALAAAVPVLVTVDAQHAVDAAWWKQLGTVVLVASIAGLASFVKGVLAGTRTGTASLSRVVASTAVPQPQLTPPVKVDTPAAPASDVPPPLDLTPPADPVPAPTP